MDELVAFALSEARKLESAGLDACIVENVGDVPLFRDKVPPVTVAAMSVLVTEVRRATSMHVGVNILRNAWEEALSIAHVCGADFIRVQRRDRRLRHRPGIIQGCAAELARLPAIARLRGPDLRRRPRQARAHRSSTCRSSTPPRISPSAAGSTR
jgi:predicted TIM-barrel enzyme